LIVGGRDDYALVFDKDIGPHPVYKYDDGFFGFREGIGNARMVDARQR